MGKLVVGVALACTGLVAGAGGATTTASPGGPSTSVAATTTTSPAAPGALPTAVDTVVVRSAADGDEPLCTDSERGPEVGVDPAVDRAAADALLPMMSVVNTYGVPLGDEFLGSGQSRDSDGERVVVAVFVADVAEHRAALVELVDDPDHLVVCRGQLSAGEAAALVAAIQPVIAGRGNASPGGLDGRVSVDLFAGNELVAESLHTSYGDQVDITLGVFPYPMPDPAPESVCPDLAPTSSDLVYAVEEPAPIALEAAAGFDTRVAMPFLNASPQRIAFLTGYPWPYLVDPDSGDVIGVSNASVGLAALGITADLEPGERFDQDVWVPTASCDPTLGHTVAPGTYHLYAVNSVVRDTINITEGDIAVGPNPVTITNPT